jgi:hypothetical protein
VLDPDESERLRALFRELSEVDSHMVDAINDVASWLTSEALTTGDLVERNDFASANVRVLAARRVIRPLRERIAHAMIQIRRLEGDFIEISGAV